MQAKIIKNPRHWKIEGLVGMSRAEVDSVAGQVLSMPDLRGDTSLLLHTKQGYEHWSATDLSNDSTRILLIEKL